MNIHQYDRAIVYGYPIADVLLLVVLFVRRRAASFPLFTVCIAIDAAVCAGLIVVSHHQPHIFRSTYFTLNSLNQAIQLLVVYEISMQVFRPTGIWARDVRRTLLEVAGGAVLLAFLFALLAHPPSTDPVYALMQRINMFYCILMVELFAGMLVLSSTAGLPWKTHAARIAQGFGALSLIYLLSHVMTSTLNITRHSQLFVARSRICISLYLVCQAYWIIMLWRDAPAPQELPERLRIQIYTLQRQVENDLIRIRSWKSN